MNNINTNQTSSKPGKLFIIAAPSGAGKTTLVRTLCTQISNLLVSISYTTRPKRPGEENGKDYHFVDKATFSKMVEQDKFLEYATVFGHDYGTSRQWVEEELGKSNDIILEIDWQGAQDIRKLMSGCVSIFILPPTYSTLEERLRGRDSDDASIQRRMSAALNELSHYSEFDYLVVNDKLEDALTELKQIIESIRQEIPYIAPDYQEFAQQLVTNGGSFK